EHEAQDELVEIGGSQYRVHSAAAVFPIMSGREFDELVEDVRVNGLREPVVASGDQLIDGRNRVRACAAAGVVPEVRELTRGTDVASWVMSVNLHRRHLDASQRALLASRLSALSGEVTLGQAGEMMGVSRASVARAAAVEKGPEPLRAAAREGVVSVGDAYELRGEEPETKQLVEDVRSGAAPNLRAAMRQRGIKGKPRKKDPRDRKPKAAASEPGQSSGQADDGGGGVSLGPLVDPEEPGPGRPATTPGPEAETLPPCREERGSDEYGRHCSPRRRPRCFETVHQPGWRRRNCCPASRGWRGWAFYSRLCSWARRLCPGGTPMGSFVARARMVLACVGGP
ncbi:MAG: ParB/RepB/Spo0J family partition protein, partial [Rhodospirillales bacterium]|nr:ParB/RepB/Spo0J family partition protein [Rhodospirillales bacterium]